VCRLCDKNTRKKRDSRLLAPTSFTLGPFQISSSGPERSVPKDLSRVFDWDLWLEGWYRFLEMVARSARSDRTADLIAWMQKLSRFPGGSGEAKVKYARTFMHKYADVKCDNWNALFDSDSALLVEHLIVAPPRRERSVTARPRGRRADSPSPRPVKRAKRPKLCFSRLKLSAGKCSFTPCKFGHKCVSCGGDHAAVDCKTWDQGKADAFMARK